MGYRLCRRPLESDTRCMDVGMPWADYGHIWANVEVLGLQLAVSWGVLGNPWAGLGLMLEPAVSRCYTHMQM